MLFPLAAHDTETIAILDRPGRRIEIGMASSEKVAHLVLKRSWIKALRTDVYIVRVRRRDCRTEGVKLVDHQSKVVERWQIDLESWFDDRLDNGPGAKAKIVPLLAGVGKLEPVENAKLGVHTTPD
jgi:hypothetical protein